MFNSLQDTLSNALKRLRGRSIINASEIEAAMKDVRMALLQADVNYKVVKDFCSAVSEKSLGQDVLKSLTPDKQIIKIVHEELARTMGSEATALELNVEPPAIIMLVGLQGSGKTTTSGKLARLLKKDQKRNPLLVSVDVYRPAAIEQLRILAQQLELDFFEAPSGSKPEEIARLALEWAKGHGHDVIILDTAGRLQIDTDLMSELRALSALLSPQETLLVADSMTGQEAVNVAQGFDTALSLTGLILTKLDGDARGGAALSMRAVTGKPIKFIGVGEKLDALEVFHPTRMASRILGMGDMLSFIEKAVQEVDLEETIKLQKRMKKNEFSFDDFLGQLRMIKRMGSIGGLASMIPGMGKMLEKVDTNQAEAEVKRIEAIILSMTARERNDSGIINGSRRRRIAQGSGTTVEEVNRLLKQFVEMKKMMKSFTKGGMSGLMNMFGKGFPGMGRP